MNTLIFLMVTFWIVKYEYFNMKKLQITVELRADNIKKMGESGRTMSELIDELLTRYFSNIYTLKESILQKKNKEYIFRNSVLQEQVYSLIHIIESQSVAINELNIASTGLINTTEKNKVEEYFS